MGYLDLAGRGEGGQKSCNHSKKAKFTYIDGSLRLDTIYVGALLRMHDFASPSVSPASYNLSRGGAIVGN